MPSALGSPRIIRRTGALGFAPVELLVCSGRWPWPEEVPDSLMWGLLRRVGWMAVILLLGLLTVAAVVAGSSDRPGSQAPGDPEQAAVKTFSEWLDEAQVQATTKAQWAAVARSNAIVVLNSWDFRLIPVLKRANPQGSGLGIQGLVRSALRRLHRAGW